jgi:hypothetical protein
MAIPSRQIGWSTEDNLLWQISKQLEQLTNVTAKGCTTTTTTTTLPAYKVYTALLTQSGGNNIVGFTGGNTVIGLTYEIYEAVGGATGFDFTNIGAPNNNIGTFFVATGTTPASWGNNNVGLKYNEGAPTVIVLENTIGNIWFTYGSVGLYSIYTDSQFIQDKTFAFFAFPGAAGNGGSASIYVNQAPQNLPIETRLYDGTSSDGILYETSFEIRVYN